MKIEKTYEKHWTLKYFRGISNNLNQLDFYDLELCISVQKNNWNLLW